MRVHGVGRSREIRDLRKIRIHVFEGCETWLFSSVCSVFKKKQVQKMFVYLVRIVCRSIYGQNLVWCSMVFMVFQLIHQFVIDLLFFDSGSLVEMKLILLSYLIGKKEVGQKWLKFLSLDYIFDLCFLLLLLAID